MSDEHVEATIKPSKQIDKYLKPLARNRKKQSRLSFEEIMECFIGKFVIDAPDRAEIFINDRVARSAYGLLKRAAILLENYLPKIDFDRYLQICIANACHSRRVCELLRSNHPANKLAMFELLTDIICHALAIFDRDISAEIKLECLSKAQWYFAELNLINVNQRQRAQGPRSDALNELIFALVGNNRDITVVELLKELEHYDIIEEITEEYIYFIQPNGKQGKPAPITGLKDRLYRAIKKIGLVA